MKKLRLALGATLLSTALLATGCTGTGGPDGEIVLEAVDTYGAGSPQSAAIEWLYAEYADSHPGVRIERTVIPADILQKLQAQATTDSLPDIAMIDNPNFPVLEATGKLRDLPLSEWGLEDAYLEGAQEVVTDEEGNVRGLFIGTNTMAILYNVDMFEKAGIAEPPATWAEFQQVAEKLSGDGVTGFMFAGINNGCSVWQYNPWQWTAGGSDDDLTDDGNAKALSFLAGLVDSNAASKDVVNQCQDEGMNALAQGQAAMIQNGPWSFSSLNEASDLNWDSFPIPVPSEGDKLIVPLGGEVWTLPSTGDETRETASEEFLEWSQQPEILSEFDERLGYVPVLTSLWPDVEEAHPEMAAFIDSLEFARGRTTLLGTKTPSQVAAVGTAIQQALLGEKTPEQALSAAQEEFDAQ